MSRAQLTLDSTSARERAIKWIAAMPSGTRVIFKDAKRTIPQNDRMWAMLTEVATQVEWHGKKLKPDSWKLLFLDALSSEMSLVPNIDGTGFVNLGYSSSNLSKADFGNLLELIAAFGANHGVIFRDQSEIAA